MRVVLDTNVLVSALLMEASLSIASGGAADDLVTGDKPHLLALGSHAGTNIVSVRDFMTLVRWSS